MKTCLLGVLSWCDSNRFPNRFKIFKKSVNSIKKYLSRNNCVFAIVDNNSSLDVKEFIKSSSVFDIKILLPENIHDTGALSILRKICKDKQLKYFFPIDNDHVFFRNDFLDFCLNMLDDHPECGYARLLKFRYNRKDYFDKSKQNIIGHDFANERWMYNLVSNKKLEWEGPFNKDRLVFYINNWHWATCGPLVRLDVWDKIFPKKQELMPVYYDSEKQMRENYERLGLKTLVLDGGAFSQEDVSVYQSSFKTFTGTILGNFRNKLLKKSKPYIEYSKLKYYVNNYQKFQILK